MMRGRARLVLSAVLTSGFFAAVITTIPDQVPGSALGANAVATRPGAPASLPPTAVVLPALTATQIPAPAVTVASAGTTVDPPATTAGPGPAPAADSLATVWACIRQRESGDNYAENTGNGYYGAYQFLESTWLEIGGTGYPDQAPPAVQDALAQTLQAMEGWTPWPVTSRLCGA
jgi:hypothetical protein